MVPRPALPSDRKWQAQADALELNALTTVRDAAQKWAGTLGALTGLLGLVALVKGPEDLTGLAPWPSPFPPISGTVAVAVVLGVALACAFVATYLAALAAQGIPHETYLDGTILRRESPRQAAKAARYLLYSRVLVIPATLLLVVGAGLTWLGPRVPAPGPILLVVQRSGAILCGPMQTDQTGRVSLTLTGSGQTAISASDAASVQTISGCH
jgi:hypothetical protein